LIFVPELFTTRLTCRAIVVNKFETVAQVFDLLYRRLAACWTGENAIAPQAAIN